MKQERLQRALLIVFVPVAAALVIRYLFDVDGLNALWNLMTLTFFVSLPYLVGVLNC